jgi:hypothetical protein
MRMFESWDVAGCPAADSKNKWLELLAPDGSEQARGKMSIELDTVQ